MAQHLEVIEERLRDWKFLAAAAYLLAEDETPYSAEAEALIVALSHLFENVGHFEGDLAVVVRNALANIGIEQEA